MPSSKPSILLDIGGNVLARTGGAIVQVRSGALTSEVFSALTTTVRRLMSREHGALGLLSLIEPSAEVVAEELRARQKEFVSRVLERPDVRMAVVNVGDDVAASMKRTMARMLVRPHERLRACKDIAEACAYVGPHAGVPVQELAEMIEEARRVAARSASA